MKAQEEHIYLKALDRIGELLKKIEELKDECDLMEQQNADLENELYEYRTHEQIEDDTACYLNEVRKQMGNF